MPPYQGGGDMIERVSFSGTTFKPAPARFEAGTPSFVDVIGLGAAIDYINAAGHDNIAAHENGLLEKATRVLTQIGGVKIYGTAPHKAAILSFTADWGSAGDIAMILDQRGVAVRAGHHCCMPLMESFGIEGTVRVSFGLYSNDDDVTAFESAMNKAKDLLS
jgi:cysteine desulfurase/selenocysteine lyase